MSEKYFHDLVVPQGFPEAFKRKIIEKNKQLQLQRDMIDQEPIYDQFTINCINDFISSFQKLYPGILSDEELLTRIKANLKHPIKLVENPNLNDTKIKGLFNVDKHEIILNNKYVNNNEIDDMGKSTLFHELTHVLVVNNPFDISIHEVHEDSNFIVESIVTIMEEEYAKKILHMKEDRVNGYIPTYAREIYAIFGKELISEYIKKYRIIDRLFDEISNKDDFISFDILNRLADEIDEIYYSIKEKNNDVNVAYLNRNIELGITTVLDHYLSNKELSDEEKLNKIISLVKQQIAPDFRVIREIIKKHINDKSLIEKDNYAKNLYYGIQFDIDKSKDIVDLIKKEKDYNSCGLYGANKIDKEESSFGLPTYVYDEYVEYQYNKKLYDTLYELLEENKISNEDLEIIKLKKTKELTKDELISIRDQLAHGIDPGLINLVKALRLEETIHKCTTKNGEFYIKTSLYDELLRKGSILDAINHYKNLKEQAKDKAEIEVYQDAIKKLLELVSKNIHDIYYSDSSFIYEINDKVFINDANYKEDENEEETGFITTSEIEMEEIESPYKGHNYKQY